MIRQATIKHVKDILEIVNSVLLKNLNSRKFGFLLENLGAEFYKKIITKSKYCYVVLVRNKLTGFLIAYPNNLLKKSDESQLYLIKRYKKDKFIYIYQIAINPSCQKKNYGSKLYQKLFGETRGIKKIVLTSAKPYN